jgi:hypothetical protein
MYRATREFILARQKHTSWKLTTPKVSQIGGGEPNRCFENAVKVMKASEASDNKQIVMTGWIVQPFDKVNKCTAIIQHWWNADLAGNQYDTTLLPDKSEYVHDIGLAEYHGKNLDRIDGNLAMSLLYQDGRFERLVDFEAMVFQPLNELRTDLLFKYK